RLTLVLFIQSHHALPHLPSSPTRRSSDLISCATCRAFTRRNSPTPGGTSCSRSSTCRRRRWRDPWGSSPRAWARNWDFSPCCSRSEEHTSELQSRENLVCRLLLEKKNK